MLKATKDFYKKTKLNKKGFEFEEKEAPLTHVKVFYKEYPRFKSIPLEKIEDEGEFHTLLDIRESSRYFSDTPINFQDLSIILNSCRIVNPTRDPEKRTYPSGGARFPVELYLLSYNVEDLEEGAYHYNIKNSSLELLLKQSLKNKRRELISPFLENPAATIFFTSVISRSEIKYGYRSYPYSLIEAGHMGQNIHLKCSEIGIGSCPVSGFIDDNIIRILDLTENEIPLYSISLGRIRGRI